MKIKHGRGYVYAIEYHIVWCVKYRHKVLSKEMLSALEAILHTVANDIGITLEEFNGEGDHVHLLVSAFPQCNIPYMIQKLKGVSSRVVMKKFRTVLKRKLWGGHLWNPSYFIATVSENTEEQIRNYIKKQGCEKSRKGV